MAPTPAPSILATTGLPDLGPLADRAALIAAARPFATTAPPAGAGPCAGYPPPLATATFQGTPAYLVVIEQSAAGNRIALGRHRHVRRPGQGRPRRGLTTDGAVRAGR